MRYKIRSVKQNFRYQRPLAPPALPKFDGTGQQRVSLFIPELTHILEQAMCSDQEKVCYLQASLTGKIWPLRQFQKEEAEGKVGGKAAFAANKKSCQQ